MRKKSLDPKNLQLEIKSKTKFWSPVTRNGWWIKFSTFRENYILLTIISQYTAQTLIRYYTNEEDAVEFINFVTLCNPTETFQSV